MNKAEFLSHVQKRAALAGPKEAERWSVAVLKTLSDVLPDSESRRHFAAQLPGFLKSRMKAAPPRRLVMTRDAFLQHLGRALGVHAPQAERALGTVLDVLRQSVSAGQLDDFEAQVPDEIAALLARKTGT